MKPGTAKTLRKIIEAALRGQLDKVLAQQLHKLGPEAVALASCFTIAPIPCNLFVLEYPGSSEKEGREDSNDIFAVEHKIFQPFDLDSGLPTGFVIHNPLTVVKVIDKATPGLHKALVTGENLSEVTLRWYRIDPTAAVAPERILSGRSGAMFDGNLLPDGPASRPRRFSSSSPRQLLSHSPVPAGISPEP